MAGFAQVIEQMFEKAMQEAEERAFVRALDALKARP